MDKEDNISEESSSLDSQQKSLKMDKQNELEGKSSADISVEESEGATVIPVADNAPSMRESQIELFQEIEESFESPETESERSKLISEALQQEDEFLEYLMSLPAATSGAKDKPPEKLPPVQPPLMRSMSTHAANTPSGTKVGLDHLDNLCKLMEQLGDLREQNSKLQRRVQYLEDLKNLQEMHKQLQEESTRRELQEAVLLRTLQQHREISAKRHQHRRLIEETFPTPSLVPKRAGSEESLSNEQQSASANKRSNKCKSVANGKLRQSLLKYQPRERSRSVGVEEIKVDELLADRSGQEDEEVKHRSQTKQQRRSVVGIPCGSKGKVSKWTKVKEAFRWEKASVVMLPEAKSQDSGIGGINNSGSVGAVCQNCGGDDTRYLRVPTADSKSGDNLLSVSPVDSVLSGHSSSACSSGGQSPGYMPCQHPLSDFNVPPSTTLSSSSSSEDLDLDVNFTDILAEYGKCKNIKSISTNNIVSMFY